MSPKSPKPLRSRGAGAQQTPRSEPRSERGDRLPIPIVAKRLGLSRTAVYDLIAAGEFKELVSVGTGSRPAVRVPEEELAQFIKRRTIVPLPRAGVAKRQSAA